VIIMLKGYLNEMLSINCHVLFTNFFYISLFMVSLPLFVGLCVCCMCDDRIMCVIWEQVILQIILGWSKLIKVGMNSGVFIKYLIVLNQILKIM